MEVFPPRKRIVARELTEAELQAAQTSAPRLAPSLASGDQNGTDSTEAVERVVDPSLPATGSIDYVLGGGGNVVTIETDAAPRKPDTLSESVVDPTVFGLRQRKHRHVAIYRWTQVILLASALIAVGGVVAWATQRTLGGRLLGAGALLLAAVAFFLTRRVKLAHRLRGYAVAAVIVALIVLLANVGLHISAGGGTPGPSGGHAPLRAPSPPRR